MLVRGGGFDANYRTARTYRDFDPGRMFPATRVLLVADHDFDALNFLPAVEFGDTLQFIGHMLTEPIGDLVVGPFDDNFPWNSSGVGSMPPISTVYAPGRIDQDHRPFDPLIPAGAGSARRCHCGAGVAMVAIATGRTPTTRDARTASAAV